MTRVKSKYFIVIHIKTKNVSMLFASSSVVNCCKRKKNVCLKMTCSDLTQAWDFVNSNSGSHINTNAQTVNLTNKQGNFFFLKGDFTILLSHREGRGCRMFCL